MSQALTWAAFVLAVLAASATVGRYFVDRRANELKAAAAARIEETRKAAEATFRAELADAEARVLQAQERAAGAVATTEALRLAQEPRAERLRHARVDLLKKLRLIPPVPITLTAMSGDIEPPEFATELAALFADAGWRVGPVNGMTAPGNLQGILLRHGPAQPTGSRVIELLRSAGLETEEAVDRERTNIDISVFFKPRRVTK